MLDSILFEDEAQVESLRRGSYESVLRGFGTAWPGSRLVASGATSSSEDVLLLQLVRASPMPVAVLDMRSRLIVAASESAATLFGTNADDAAGTAWDRLTDEPERTREALDLMARGGIDAYEARRRLRRPDGTAVPVYLWLRHLAPQGYPDRALVFLTPHGPQHRDRDPSEFPRIAPSTPDMTVGTTDPEWRVDRITPGVEQLLGSSNAQFQDASVFGLVHPDDARDLLDAITRTVTDRAGVGLTLRLRRMDDDWVDVRMVVSADSQDTSPRLGFAMTTGTEPQAGPANASGQGQDQRVAHVEQTLRRVVNEIQALGIASAIAQLPPGLSVPELANLSARQSEIVARLLRGDRVPSIARSMFLSQSTVRNHLSAVYRKLGVHSQQELIERLRGISDSPSSTE